MRSFINTIFCQSWDILVILHERFLYACSSHQFELGEAQLEKVMSYISVHQSEFSNIWIKMTVKWQLRQDSEDHSWSNHAHTLIFLFYYYFFQFCLFSH